MPIREFECPKCGKIHEKLVLHSDKDKVKAYLCENCNSEIDMIVSRSNFCLKGGGWAADNYCGKNKKRLDIVK